MRVVLISMPFASLAMPSLALTQLAAALEPLGDAVHTDTLYFNLDFARYLGSTADYEIALQDAGFMTGLGDYVFRRAAFPEAEDNLQDYLARYCFEDNAVSRRVRHMLEARREGLADFLDELVAAHDLAQADIVGFTALFSQTVASFAMARRIKAANPDVITVIGGAACEGVMGREFAARVPAIDYVFSGPALVSFPRFVGCRLANEPEAVRGIAGILARDTLSGAVEPGEDLDINASLPLDYGPFLDQVAAAFPDGEVKPCLLFETSRGCAWAEKSVCTFCGLNGLCKVHRCMSPPRARAELRALFEWVPRCGSFIAVDTMMPRHYVQEVFPTLAPPPALKMMYEVRPDLAGDEIGVLYDAGVVALQPGIESLSTATLKLMRKGTTAFRNIAFLKAAARYATHLDWNLLLFSPGEAASTFENYRRVLPRLAHLAPPNGVFPINFVRFSRYHQAPEEFGLDLVPQDFYALIYPFPGDAIHSIAQHFVDRNADTEAQDRWLNELGGVVRTWRDRWLGADGRPQARLCFYEDAAGRTLYDSRTGEERVLELPPLAARVLRQLERPATAAELDRAFGDDSGFDAARELAYLAEHDLLFEEDGRAMSLVVE